MGLWLIVIAIGMAAWAFISTSRLELLRAKLMEAWRQVDVQLKRRHDLVPHLVTALRASADADRDALNVVMDARAAAMTAAGPGDAARKEDRLTDSLERLLPMVPGGAKAVAEELSSIEEKLSAAGDAYNGTARRFNALQRAFPNNVGRVSREPVELFAVTDASERGYPGE